MNLVVTRLAQMSAYFLRRNGANLPMPAGRLLRLLYLADRESIDRYGEPISYDRAVATKKGPALEQAMQMLDPDSDKNEVDYALWNDWVARGETGVFLRSLAKRQRELDHMSQADIEILDAVWTEFMLMGSAELSRHCESLGEWRDSARGQHIRESHILQALGRSESEALTIAKLIQQQRNLDFTLSRTSM